MKKRTTRRLTGRAFDVLPAAEKERIYQEIDCAKPGQLWNESKRPTASERATLARIAKKIGRPKIGKGVKVVSVSVERELLDRADAYAKKQGLKRAEFFTVALRGALSAAGVGE